MQQTMAQPPGVIEMSENKLVQNGDFSNGYQHWTLEGLVQNAQNENEDGNFSGKRFRKRGQETLRYDTVTFFVYHALTRACSGWR